MIPTNNDTIESLTCLKTPIFFDKNFDIYSGLSDKTCSYITRENLRRLINRFFTKFITGNEKKVLDVIFERTCGCNKWQEVIKYDHFEKGVYSKKYAGYIQKDINLSKKTIISCLSSLIDKGLVLRSEHKTLGYRNHTFKYRIDFLYKFEEWSGMVCYGDKIVEEVPDSELEPKSFIELTLEKEDSKEQNIDVNFTTNNNIKTNIVSYKQSKGLTPSRLNNLQVNTRDNSFVLDTLKSGSGNRKKIQYNKNMLNERKKKRREAEISTANDLLARHQEEAKDTQKSKITKYITTTKPSIKAFCEVWQHFSRKEHGLKSVTFNQKSRACIKGWLQSYSGVYMFDQETISGTQLKPVTVLEFVSWSLINWNRVIKNKLHWVNAAPSLPDLRFWFSFKDQFIQEYKAAYDKYYSAKNPYLESELLLRKAGLDGEELNKATQLENERITKTLIQRDKKIKQLDKKELELQQRAEELDKREQTLIESAELVAQAKKATKKVELPDTNQDYDEDGFIIL